MLRTFTALSPYIKFKTNKISIDNLAFKFHYRATFLLLLVCTILVTSRQYIGEHIRCITGGSIPEHVINTFCFFTTTFTVIRHYNESALENGEIPHPGIGSMHHDDKVQFHAYYQWVPFVLFGQALMFYLPHFLWRTWEGGRIKALVDGLQMIALAKYAKKTDDIRLSGNCVIPSRDSVDGRMLVIKNEFFKHIRSNKMFAYRLILAELLNAANLTIQIYFTHRFLGGKFYSLGIDFIHDDFKGKMDVLDIVFPKVTKCNFYKYGASGTIQRHDALCVMALNVINEKIFIVLWFWYILMAVLTVLSILWRISTFLLYSRSRGFNKVVFSMVCPGRLNARDILLITQYTYYSDWLFLYYLAKNMEPYVFRNLLTDLSSELRNGGFDENEELLRKPVLQQSIRQPIIETPSSTEIESIDVVDSKSA